MVMMTLGSVEALLNNNPKPDSADYRNAWATVEARLMLARDPGKVSALQALRGRMEAIGEPQKRAPLTREEVMVRARAAREVAVVTRCKSDITARIAAARWQRIAVTDRKPWLFEAALQMVEAGEVSVHSATENFPERGFAPAGGAVKIKRLELAPPDPEFSRPCPWVSRKKQAEEEASI